MKEIKTKKGNRFDFKPHRLNRAEIVYPINDHDESKEPRRANLWKILGEIEISSIA